MPREEKTPLRKKPASEIEAARNHIPRLEKLTQSIVPDNASGRLSRMEALNSISVNAAALDNALIKLPKLENTLAKIDHPDFGRCTKCKAKIPFARLMFMPKSNLCIQCTRRR